MDEAKEPSPSKLHAVHSEEPVRPELASARVHQLRALDLAAVFATEDDRVRLADARGNGALWRTLCTPLIAQRSFVPTEPHIRRRVENAEASRGKAVWSELFITFHSPLQRRELLPAATLESRPLNIGTEIDSNRADAPALFLSDVQVALTRDAILLFRMAYDMPRQASCLKTIKSLAYLDRLTTANFERYLVQELPNGSISGVLSTLGLSVDPALSRESGRRLSGLAMEYSFLLVSGFVNRSGDPIPLSDVRQSPELAGVLHQSVWFGAYRPEYRAELDRTSLGTRNDEIYLIADHNFLAVQPGFWRGDDPLHKYYEPDLVLGLEFLLAKKALIATTLTYYQTDGNTAWRDRPKLDLVLQSRAILGSIRESVHLSPLVGHPFTRQLLERASEGLQLARDLALAEERIERISSSLELLAADVSAQAANNLAKRSGNWQIVAGAASVLAAAIGIILLVLQLAG